MSNDTNIDDSLHERKDSLDDVPSEEGIDDGGSLQHDEAEEVDKKTIDDLGSDIEIDANVVENVDENNLLGGLQIETTDKIPVPDRLIDQVIGQEHAHDVIMKAAKQRRHVMMVGSPGTGKSMSAKAMSELPPREEPQDVLVCHNPGDGNRPKVRTVPVGKGDQIVEAHEEEARKRNQMRSFLTWIIIAVVLSYSFIIARQVLPGILAAGITYPAFRYGSRGSDAMIPNLIVSNVDQKSTSFQDVTGAYVGMLLGNVHYDPFQSGGMETPSHDRVEPGAIRKLSKGVLFVDEINTLDVRSQQYLMVAIQKGEFSTTGQSERSSGAMTQAEPVPTGLIMIAAGNFDAAENMHPAPRSRIKGYGYEVYMDDTIEDTPEMRHKYARFMIQEVTNDGWPPHFIKEAVEEPILKARRRAGRKGHLTLEFRNLGGLVHVAGDIARDENAELTTRDHVLQAKRRARPIEQQIADQYIEHHKDYELSADDGFVTGRTDGLAVMGEDPGIILPVIAEVTPLQGSGQVIVTGQLKEMAEEFVQNVSAIIKKFSNQDLSEMDVRVQFVQIDQQGADGGSVSTMVATTVIFTLEDIPIDQLVIVTGSLSVRGDVLPVGGVIHKIEAAAKTGCSTVITPAANEQDVMIEDEYKEMVDITPVSHISEVLDAALEGESEKDSFVDRLKSITGSALSKGQGVKGPSSPNPQ